MVIALCCVIGYTRAAPNTPQDISDAPAQQAGESGLNYYLSWIDDDAGLFSMDTTDTLARSNLSLHSNYGCLMAIQTINYLNGQDIETYAKNRFEETELGSMDMRWSSKPATRPGTWSTAAPSAPMWRRAASPPPCPLWCPTT